MDSIFEKTKKKLEQLAPMVWENVKKSSKDLTLKKVLIKGVKFVGPIAIHSVVVQVLKHNMSTIEMKKVDKALVGIGSYMISMTICDKVTDYIVDSLEENMFEPEK